MKSSKFASLALAAVMAVGCMVGMTSCAPTEGFSKNTFNIGATGPLTGGAASYGISVQHGAQIAIDEINAAGGLNGIKFAFEMKDDKAEAAAAQTGYNALFDAGMQASIGSVTSGSCKSFCDEAVKDKVFALTPSASEEAVIEKGANVFRVCFGDAQQGYLASDTLFASYTKVGVIYDTSDSYSSGLYAAFKEQSDKNGKVEGTDYVVFSFDADNKKDFSSQVSGLKSAGCDVIFLPIYYTEAGLIAKKAAAEGFNVPVFGCDGLDGVADQLDASVTATVSYITPFDADSTDAKIAKFVSAYKEKYNATPDQFAADGYDAVMVIFEAMKKANVSDASVSASDLCNTLTYTITAADFSYTGVTGTMSWKAADGGSCTKTAQIKTVK